MAPIKFEEHVKEKLDEREIQPSAGSWDQLNSRLNNSKKSSGNRWWLSAVAAVAVVIVASLLFVNQQEQTSMPIVEKPAEINTDNNADKVQFEQPAEIASEESIENEEVESKPSIQEYSEESQNIENGENSGIASNDIQKREIITPISIESEVPKTVSQPKLSEKMQELLATISQKNSNSGSEITEAEVDALLAEAVKEISNKREPYSQSEINASELLAEAEDELYQSFKEKVFEIVKSGYQKAAVAVSNKLDNNQNQ
ncbi:hypothetical protein [Christiangramia sp. SM2212]|uniref:Uncharacterized protein n=1 Tax=Christiangramia sediminicola TaxID=3073267 RepID=A0ABU1ETS5_9FLAO|nr:hypothetical protein [Christiangramia sp. SM2212]MDR5591800.1 hypothetical protein [Christiangramia sp. SM2212]